MKQPSRLAKSSPGETLHMIVGPPDIYVSRSREKCFCVLRMGLPNNITWVRKIGQSAAVSNFQFRALLSTRLFRHCAKSPMRRISIGSIENDDDQTIMQLDLQGENTSDRKRVHINPQGPMEFDHPDGPLHQFVGRTC
jgi:hypothetical protein